MKSSTALETFTPIEDVGHVEISFVTYDQWILTIGVRHYGKKDGRVVGMSHVIFEQPEGFRVLDEGCMLQFPWAKLSKSRSYIHVVESGGWLGIEESAGNLHLPATAKEYVVISDNDCVSVLAYKNPIKVMC